MKDAVIWASLWGEGAKLTRLPGDSGTVVDVYTTLPAGGALGGGRVHCQGWVPGGLFARWGG